MDESAANKPVLEPADGAVPDPRSEPLPILTFFSYAHLPPDLQAVSKPLHDQAYAMFDILSPSAELSAGLRKLLEAKDCFVRAALAGRKMPDVDEDQFPSSF